MMDEKENSAVTSGPPQYAENETAALVGELADNPHHARLRRVYDYEASALRRPEPLEATLGSINSALMRMSLWLTEAIEAAMENGAPQVERLPKMMPALEMHLRFTRQIERFSQLGLRTLEARKHRVKEPPRAELGPDPTFDQIADESEDLEI